MTAVDLDALGEGWGYEIKLGELVRRHLLECRYANRHHPGQAYRTREESHP